MSHGLRRRRCSTTKGTWNFFEHSASSTCATSPIRCQKRRYNGWTDPINYQFTRSIDQYNLDQSSSEDESTDNDDEHGEGEFGPAIQSARSHDLGRTVFYPDIFVLTDNEHWIMTPEAHKYAAAAGSFCFVTMENGEQQDLYNLSTIPCVQRSLCLDEVINDSSSAQVEFPKGVNSQTRDTLERYMATCGKAAGARAKRRSRAQKEASPQELRGYYKQFAEAKHLEWEIFD